MLKSKLALFIIAVFFFAGCVTLPKTSPVVETQRSQSAEVEDHQIISIQINDKTLSVEAVTSAESITKGLGERDSIGSDGMLFFMPDREVVYFWMHGMRFPLDMIWIDDGKIVGIEKNVPAPEYPSSTRLPSYSSKVPVTQVLELPAGKADELELETGMKVE